MDMELKLSGQTKLHDEHHIELGGQVYEINFMGAEETVPGFGYEVDTYIFLGQALR